jgi:hypothetical protein
MSIQLTDKDRDMIWQIVDHAAESMGGFHHLFASPLEFSEDDNRIQFNWPVWMRAIKAYIISQYGEKSLDLLLLDILAEVYDPQKYQRFLEQKKHKLQHSGSDISYPLNRKNSA